jgi:hypothetical protein
VVVDEPEPPRRCEISQPIVDRDDRGRITMDGCAGFTGGSAARHNVNRRASAISAIAVLSPAGLRHAQRGRQEGHQKEDP